MPHLYNTHLTLSLFYNISQERVLNLVSDPESSNFLQVQGGQRIARRRTCGTLHKKSCRPTQKLRKRAISGQKLNKQLCKANNTKPKLRIELLIYMD
jgi:hypothetical protein